MRTTAAELNRAAGAAADLDALGRARARRARGAARRDRAGRGARAAARRCSRELGLEPLPSRANFLFVPVDEPDGARRGAAPRQASSCASSRTAIRIIDSRPRGRRSPARGARPRARPPVARRAGATRRVRHVRATAETRIRVRLALDGAGRVRVATGAGLYDHLLEQLAFHAGSTSCSRASATSRPAPHHTAEDAALALGEALDRALGDRRGIARYGDAVVPMDDALARGAVDLGGRPCVRAPARARSGPGRARAARASRRRGGCAIHVEASGRDEHHVAEAAFKAVGRALRAAVAARGRRAPVDEGAAVNVAVCDYGAGNVRSVRRRVRAGSAPTRVATSSPGDVAADLAVLPGVGSAASAMAGLRERGLDEALRERVAGGGPTLGICLGLQLALEETRRTAASPGSASSRAAPCGCARAASRASAGRAVEPTATRSTSRTRTPRRRPPRPRARRASSRRPSAAASSASSSIPRRAAPAGARFAGAMPLPRLIPCLDVAGGRVVKGVRFEGLRDVGDPVELGARVLRRRRRRARLPRREGDARGARRARRARRAGSPSGWRFRSPSAAACARSPTPRRCSRPARTRSRSTPPRSSGRS